MKEAEDVGTQKETNKWKNSLEDRKKRDGARAKKNKKQGTVGDRQSSVTEPEQKSLYPNQAALEKWLHREVVPRGKSTILYVI